MQKMFIVLKLTLYQEKLFPTLPVAYRAPIYSPPCTPCFACSALCMKNGIR